MHLNYAMAGKRPQILQQLTGLRPAEFDVLLPKFEVAYKRVVEARWAGRERQRAPGGGRNGTIPSIDDKLLFALVYVRLYPLLVVQGLLFGMAESRATP